MNNNIVHGFRLLLTDLLLAYAVLVKDNNPGSRDSKYR